MKTRVGCILTHFIKATPLKHLCPSTPCLKLLLGYLMKYLHISKPDLAIRLPLHGGVLWLEMRWLCPIAWIKRGCFNTSKGGHIWKRWSRRGTSSEQCGFKPCRCAILVCSYLIIIIIMIIMGTLILIIIIIIMITIIMILMIITILIMIIIKTIIILILIIITTLCRPTREPLAKGNTPGVPSCGAEQDIREEAEVQYFCTPLPRQVGR